MAYQPKSYRKFIAGAATAAIVASAVAPAASAADLTFSDVGEDFWAATEIYTLVEAGVINGYPDSTFKPGEDIIRGQAANLLTEALELEVPSDLNAFPDVSEKSVFAKGAAATKAAGIFGGSEGKFGAADVLTREQMASVLVRAFDLEDTGEEVTFTDWDKISASHRENVKILAQYGITTGKEDGSFDPKSPVNRATFVTFLYRAMGIEAAPAAEVVEVKSIDTTTLQVKVKGQLEEVSASDFEFDGGLEVKEAKIVEAPAAAAEDEVYTTVELTTSEQEEGKTYNLVSFLGAEVEGDVSVEVPVYTPAVTGVSAINATDASRTVTLSAGAAVDANSVFELELSEAVKADSVNSASVKLYKEGALTSVTTSLSDDKKTVTVTPGLLLEEGKNYKLVVEGLKGESDKEVAKYEASFNVATTPVVIANKYSVSGGAPVAFPATALLDSGSVTFGASGYLEFELNKTIDTATVNTTNVKLKNVTDGTFIALDSVAVAAGTNKIRLDLPGSANLADKTYEVYINNVKALDGTTLPNYTYKFVKTATAVSYTEQGVLGLSTSNVYNKLQGQLLEGTYYNGFSAKYTANKELDASSVNSNTVKLYKVKDGVETLVDSTVDFSGGMISVTPKADLDEASSFKVTFDGVKDKNGIKLAKVDKTFTSGDYTAVTITSASPSPSAAVEPAKAELVFNFSEKVEDDSNEVVLGNANDFSSNDTIIMYDAATNAAVNLSGLSKVWDAERKVLKVDISSVVQPGKTYTVKVAGANSGTGYVNADAGQVKKLANDYSFSFVTQADGTKPTVDTVKGSFTGAATSSEGSYLLNGASNVAINKDIRITFKDKDVTPVADSGSTVTSSTSHVKIYDITSGTPTRVDNIRYEIVNGGANADYLVIKAGTTNLTADKKYRVTLTDSITDTAGNKMNEVSYEFTTGQGPTLSAKVGTDLATSPTAFPVSANIVLAANENVKASTVNSESVKLVDYTTGEEVSAAITVSGQDITINPTADLAGQTKFKVVVKPTVTDANGNKLYNAATGDATVNTEFVFTTSDTVKPTVVNTSVSNGATNVDRNAEIKFTFSEKVVRDNTVGVQAMASAGTDTFVLGTLADFNDGTIDSPIGITVSAPGGLTATGATEYTVKPTAALSADTQYVLVAIGDNVATNTVGITDVNDNPLAQNYVLNFTTGTTTTDTVAPSFADAISIEVDNSTPTDVTDTNGVFNVASAKAANNIAIKFDETIDVSGATVSMFDVTNNKNFEVLSKAKIANQYLDVNPLVNLSASTLYKVTIKGVKDASGNVADDVVVYIQVGA